MSWADLLKWDIGLTLRMFWRLGYLSHVIYVFCLFRKRFILPFLTRHLICWWFVRFIKSICHGQIPISGNSRNDLFNLVENLRIIRLNSKYVSFRDFMSYSLPMLLTTEWYKLTRLSDIDQIYNCLGTSHHYLYNINMLFIKPIGILILLHFVYMMKFVI